MTYAKNTTVSVEKSRAEIESTLARYRAHSFGYATQPGRAMVTFQIKDSTGTMLVIRMTLKLPERGDKRFSQKKRGWGSYPEEKITENWEQAYRSSWRSLCLVIKAKLEACSAGISTIEREFLADVMLPSGRTMGEEMVPQLRTIPDGQMPRLMLTSGAST